MAEPPSASRSTIPPPAGREQARGATRQGRSESPSASRAPDRHQQRDNDQREQHEAAAVAPPRGVAGHSTEQAGNTHSERDAYRQHPRLAEHELSQRRHQAGTLAGGRASAAMRSQLTSTSAPAM